MSDGATWFSQRVVMSRNSKNLIRYICVYGFCLWSLAFLLIPILWIVSISLKTRVQILTSPPLFIWEPTIDNYIDVINASDFGPAIINSMAASGGAVLISLILGVPAAYTMARGKFYGKQQIYYSLLIVRMLPPISVLIPMFVLFNFLWIGKGLIALILSYTTFCLPLVVWVMRNFFEDLPKELEESALVDGAGRFKIFMMIVLPLAKPGLVAVGILSLLLAWNDFLFAAVLTNRSAQTLPVLLAGYSTADSGVEWGSLAAGGVLVVLPVVIVSLLVQRHLVSGLSAGAVKG